MSAKHKTRGTPYDGRDYPMDAMVEAWRNLAKRAVAPVYDSLDFVPQSAEGCRLYGINGSVLYDFLSCYGSLFTYDTDYVRPVIEGLLGTGRIFTSSQNIPSQEATRFADLLRRWSGYEGGVMMKSAGGMIVESAYSALFIHGSRLGIKERDKLVVIARGAFHGRARTTQTNARYDEKQYLGKGPRAAGILVVDYTVEAVEEAFNRHGHRICGVLLEPIQGEGGPRAGAAGALLAARLCTRKTGALLAVDEIQSGLRRTGYKMGFEHFLAPGDRPDIVLLGKSLGWGIVATSVMLGTTEAMSLMPRGADGETYGGNPLACALGMRALDVIENENIGWRAEMLGARLADRVNEAGIRGVRAENYGALVRIEVDGIESAAPLAKRMALDPGLPVHVFMKAGRYDAARDTAYMRVSLMPLGTTVGDVDLVCKDALIPTLQETSDFVAR